MVKLKTLSSHFYFFLLLLLVLLFYNALRPYWDGSLGDKLLKIMPGNTLSLFWSSIEVTSFSCGEFEKEFRNEVFLHSHINAYHDKRSFTCEQCQEIVVGNKFFLNHKRNHQGRSDKKVIQRKSTSRSTRQSSKSTIGAPICDKCGKSFSKMSNLVRHKVVHEKERAKFVCNMCDIEFTRKDNLEEHVNSAHVSRPRPNAIITEAVFKKD